MNGVWREKIDRAAFVLFCILAADCAMLGSGKLLHVGPVSLRMALSAAVVLLTLPQVFQNMRSLLRRPTVLCIAAFALWCFVAAGIGIARGNDKALLLSDLKGFAYLALVPGAVCLLRDTDRMRTLSVVVWGASVALALFCVLVVGLHLAAPARTDVIGLALHGVGLSSYARISDAILRFFPYSCMYLLTGLLLSAHFAAQQKTFVRAVMFVFAGALQCFGLFFTYTRSLYGGCGVAILALVVLACFCCRISYVKALGALAASAAVVICCLVLLGAAMRTDYVHYALVRLGVCEQDDTRYSAMTDDAQDSVQEQMDYFNELSESSDQVRQDTVSDLLDGIKVSPIFGSGLGAKIPARPDGVNEYFYLDLMYKSGVIGVMLYLSALVVAAVRLLRRHTAEYACLWLCALAGFAAFSFFMPYMNASLGIFTYASTLAMVENMPKKCVATDEKKL